MAWNTELPRFARRAADMTAPAPTPREVANRICLAAGMSVDTPSGPRGVEVLTPGTHVRVAGQDTVALGAMTSVSLDGTGDNAPVLIRAGHFGLRRDIVLAPWQVVRLAGWQAQLKFGTGPADRPAQALVDGHRIVRMPQAQVTYHCLRIETTAPVLVQGLACMATPVALAAVPALPERSAA